MSFSTIQYKIINESKVDRYINTKDNKDDKYAIELMNGINKADSFRELVNSFIKHSTYVFKGETAFDYLNGCDGDESPLSLFVYELLKKENLDYYTEFLAIIQTEIDYDNCEWIINEINTLIWTNPLEYRVQFEMFIHHSILGPHFSFWSAIWVDSCYYSQKNISLAIVDALYVYYFAMYTIIVTKPVSRFRNEYTTIINAITKVERQKRNFISPFDFSQYALEIEKDLRFRHLTEKELPQFYHVLNTFKTEVNKKEFSNSLLNNALDTSTTQN